MSHTGLPECERPPDRASIGPLPNEFWQFTKHHRSSQRLTEQGVHAAAHRTGDLAAEPVDNTTNAASTRRSPPCSASSRMSTGTCAPTNANGCFGNVPGLRRHLHIVRSRLDDAATVHGCRSQARHRLGLVGTGQRTGQTGKIAGVQSGHARSSEGPESGRMFVQSTPLFSCVLPHTRGASRFRILGCGRCPCSRPCRRAVRRGCREVAAPIREPTRRPRTAAGGCE